MKIRFVAVLIFLSVEAPGHLQAQPAAFLLSTDTLSSAYVSASIGNGYIGIASTQPGVLPAPSYMAWMFDHAPHDVARIAALPSWNEVDVFNGKSWLSSARQEAGVLQRYRQTLNMFDGVLETSYTWNDGGKATRIAVTLLVSRAKAHLAAIRLAVTPQFSGSMRISVPIRQWPEPRRMPLGEEAKIQVQVVNGHPDVWYPGHMTLMGRGAMAERNGGVCWVTAKPDGSPSAVAIVTHATWNAGTAVLKIVADTGGSGPMLTATFSAKAGKTYTLENLIAIVSSRDTADPLASARGIASAAAMHGYASAARENAQAWHDLWKTDITVKGDPSLQKAIHSSMFYLLCSAREGTGFAIPPMGLSSDGYYGHIFWDSDTWMFPGLLLTHPEIARSLVMFRYLALPAARANASANGHVGAMYPWESDEDGREATPRFAYQNALLENHVTGDVAFAQWQYFLATADTPWLAHYGLPVIEATADFWAHRATYDSVKDIYSIDSVVSVDEGLVGVSNDIYTNSIAKRNLEIAARGCAITGKEPDQLWSRVAGKLVMPVDSARKVHRPYQNAPDSIVGGVAPLTVFPLGLVSSGEIMANDLRNAWGIVEKKGPGAMMTITLYPVVAAALHNRDLFDRFSRVSYRPFMRGSFNVFAETPKNQATNFLTGAGGFLQQVLFGYTGLRITEEGLKAAYAPMLPGGVTEMSISGMPFRGERYDITVANGVTRIVKK